jgi:hypothetical protein
MPAVDHDLRIAQRMLSGDTALGRWLAQEREALCAELGRKPTQREFADHAVARLRIDPQVRAMAVEAARQATAAVRDEA